MAKSLFGNIRLAGISVDSAGRAVIADEALAPAVADAIQTGNLASQPDFLNRGCVTNQGCTIRQN